MKKIAFIGKGDKRVFVYPTLNLCKSAGKSCVITDDVAYKRLYTGYDNTDEIEGIEINIVPVFGSDPEQDSVEHLKELVNQKEKEGFDILIYVLDGYFPKDADKTLAVISQSKTFLGWELDSFKHKHPDVEFALMSMYNMEKPSNVKVNMFSWNMKHLMYFGRVEEYKLLYPLDDAKINAFIAKYFHEPLNITEQTFLKLASAKPRKK